MDSERSFQVDDRINKLECMVNTETLNGDILATARRCLSDLLLSRTENPTDDRSISSVLQFLAKESGSRSYEAACLVRFLAVTGLIPKPDSTNQIARSTVELCEHHLPTLFSFIGATEKKQTYEKFDLLLAAHERMCLQLAALKSAPKEIDGLLASRQSIVSALNHSAVRTYCEPFNIRYIRSSVESIIKKISRLQKERSNPFGELKDIDEWISEAQEYCEICVSFITLHYFSHFVNAVRLAVEKYLQNARARFHADIVHRLPSNLTLQKHYPLYEEGREIFLTIPLRNAGTGFALSVSVSIAVDDNPVYFETKDISLGSIPPGDFPAIFPAMVINPSGGFDLIVTVRWTEVGSNAYDELHFEVHVSAQKNIDWENLQYNRPYTTEVVKGTSFVGRSEKKLSLANKMLRTPMESFYVTGQKRVGKTSLALASADFAKQAAPSPGIEIKYILWGRIAHDDPRQSLQALGHQIADFFCATFPANTLLPTISFEGSLSAIITLAEFADRIRPGLKYVIIMDEFDEIHPELYQYGNLAETFFANIRALTTCDNVSVVLVGGENMPFIMDRQGQKLNKLVRVGLDYFSRDQEWEDFKLLVQKPTDGTLNWHEEAVAEIYNVTRGNPYFANIVCASVFESAVRGRDGDVTPEEVKFAISSSVPAFDSNSFAHLWQDGIHKRADEREPEVLRRCRTLVAISRAARRNVPITVENIIAHKTGLLLADVDIVPVIHDFVRRGILREVNGTYDFVLPIFKLWLMQVGGNRLISDSLSEELAQNVQAVEDAAYVKSNEIVELIQQWPLYLGRRIAADDVRAWYEQVTTHVEQRLLFRILQAVHFVGEAEIREKLRMAHALIAPSLPEFIQKRRSERRMDLIITYVDGEGKSGQYYAAKYAEENRISSKSIMPPSDFTRSLNEYIKQNGRPVALVVVDDMIGTGKSFTRNWNAFRSKNREIMDEIQISISVIVLFATTVGESFVRENVMSEPGCNVDLRYCELLTQRDFAFWAGNGIWTDDTELARAKSLCRDLGVNIYADNPLGFGDQALLVVFPAGVPNNSLPILHSSSSASARIKWNPLFRRMVH